MRTDQKISLMPYELDVLGIYWLSTFNLPKSAQKLRVQFIWVILIFMRPGWNLSNNVERKTHAKYYTFIIQDDDLIFLFRGICWLFACG